MSNDHSKESIQEHIRVYLMVFGALAVLTVITVLASFIEVSNHAKYFFYNIMLQNIKNVVIINYIRMVFSPKLSDFISRNINQKSNLKYQSKS